MPVIDHLKGAILRRFARPARPQPTRHFSTIIFKVDAIGDFVLSLSAIRLLTEQCGEERCCLVLSPTVAQIAKQEFPGVQVVALGATNYAGSIRSIIPRLPDDRKKLSRIGGDRLVVLRHQRAPYHHLLLSWIRASERFGIEDTQPSWIQPYNRTSFTSRLTHTVPAPPCGPGGPQATGVCRELQLHSDLLSAVLSSPVKASELLPSFTRAQATGDACFLVAPFAGDPIKNYPVSQLVKILCATQPRLSVPLRIAGSPAQRGLLQALSRELKDAGVSEVDICCPDALSQYVNMVASARLVLTMDSATAHIATALDRPTVVILGGGHYGQFGPWQKSEKQIWLTHPMDCFHCNWQCIHPQPQCIVSISADAVTEAIMSVID